MWSTSQRRSIRLSGRPRRRGRHQDKKERGNGRHEGKGTITLKRGSDGVFLVVFLSDDYGYLLEDEIDFLCSVGLHKIRESFYFLHIFFLMRIVSCLAGLHDLGLKLFSSGSWRSVSPRCCAGDLSDRELEVHWLY